MEINWHDGWNDDNCDHTDRGRFVCKKSSENDQRPGDLRSIQSLFCFFFNFKFV